MAVDTENDHDIPSLVRELKRELNKPKNERRLAKGIDIRKVSASLARLEPTRNKLAHNELMSIPDVEKALQDLANVENAFGFVDDWTTAALKKLSLLCDHPEQKPVLVFLAMDSSGESEVPKLETHYGIEERERIPRPTCLPFVGREEKKKGISDQCTA